MENMNITNAQYVQYPFDQSPSGIQVTIDGENVFIPTGDMGNRHYAEIMRRVDAGELTIADADPLPEE